jgi:glutamate synthase (NADPH/NADH) small chain
MDEQGIRELESKCVQEQPPGCTSTCPIHLDVRSFVQQVGDGEWGEAWKTLAETLPFPRILGRICDHPCEGMCKRGEVGDPIAISALEKVCVSQSSAVRPQNHLLPSRQQKIAVIGAGLSSLVASLDLTIKGYPVTIFTEGERLGGRLWSLGEVVLPEQVILEETSSLQILGVRINLGTKLTKHLFQKICQEFEAAYLGCDAEQFDEHELDLDDAGRTRVDRTTMATSNPKVFAGGLFRESPSWIMDAYEGRRAAESIDRYLQKVSLTACRGDQGPYESRLFTDISNVGSEPVVPMASPADGYTQEEAVLEAKRCLQCQCLECVKACVYLEHFGGYPAKYARDIHTFKSVSLWRRRANTLINSCNLCGLCAVVCPEQFSMADVCYQGRSTLLAQGKMPPSAHDFALQDMLFNNSNKFALTRNEPGHEKSAYVFFPGCQLSASSPWQVKNVYSYLRERLTGGVGLILRCCGAPADWAQRQDLFQSSLEELRARWSEIGEPVAIIACSTCYNIFKTYLPEIEIASLWSLLEKVGLPKQSLGSAEGSAGLLAVQDPCTTRHEPEMHLSVRKLLTQLGGDVRELTYSRKLTQCCGYGGLVANANPSLAKDVARRRAEESPLDYVTYCAMCRDNIAAVGKRIVHILDFIWKEPSCPDPATRKGPGYSERHENRWRLKNELLCDFWGEGTEEMEDYEKIELRLSPEVRDRMEQRQILVEDVKRVIDHAEKTGKKIFNSQSKRWLACHKPMRVTYWVEYTPEGDEFVVHNAYCHRMEIIEDTR